MDKSQLEQLRHSAAHLLAAAVVNLWPNTKATIGPSIDNGFYYDFDFANPISEKDLVRIDQKMRELAKSWQGFERLEVSKEEARQRFSDNPYKLELIEDIVKTGEPITLYKSGEFVDLCRGGHIDNPNEALNHFKLLSLAGAYWRGNEKNKMLTRIYGTAFPSKEELEAHLTMLEEAKKRDHKKLGKEMGLFVFSDLVGQGLPLWTPKGTLLRELLDQQIQSLRKKYGYQRVTIPHITKKDLYETSGHWAKFENELFKIITREGHMFAMKPMNCPHHTQIFDSVPRSYKDMPQRYAETTMCYRDEQSGELSGLSRVRCLTQDDAHVFCRKSQIKQEFGYVWDIIETFYSRFGFDLKVRLSLHDPQNMKAYLGVEEDWNNAENSLREIAKERDVEYFEAAGEAAFYGPKIDFMTHDSLGRQWQVATIQLDINMPERFDLNCINEKGERERIVMIHCAIMGSIERFLSVLIEHFAGNFPLWLSPTQIAVLSVSEKQLDYARYIHGVLIDAGIRSQLSDENKSLGAKIRESTLQKVPYMVIIGDKEMASWKPEGENDNQNLIVSVRSHDGKDLGSMSLYEFQDLLKTKIEKYE
ncbi:threonine--tRNA ligase [Candidatus Roizmanbacteria bacterium]|nr:threonine--tRNA ligase [Candidatus Roizmanbacteria bacterium]